jgi:hypothetical protein
MKTSSTFRRLGRLSGSARLEAARAAEPKTKKALQEKRFVLEIAFALSFKIENLPPQASVRTLDVRQKRRGRRCWPDVCRMLNLGKEKVCGWNAE